MSSDLLRGTTPRVGKGYFRDIEITAYLDNEEAIEKTAHYAGHSSAQTTQVYDKRRGDRQRRRHRLDTALIQCSRVATDRC